MGDGGYGGHLDDTKTYVASRHMEVRRCQGSGTSTPSELSTRLSIGKELKFYSLI